MNQQAAVARAAVGPEGLINQLQSERTWAAVDLVGSDALGITAPVESYPQTRSATDEALDGFKRQTEAAGPEVAAVFAPAFEGLEGLDALRADIDNNIATSPTYNTSENEEFAEEMYNRYIAMIRPLFDATDQIARSIDDETLRTGAQLVNTTSRTIELFVDMARMHLILGARHGGINDRSEIDAAASRKVLWDRYNAALLAAEPPYDRVVDDTYPTEFNQGFTSLVERAMTGELVPVARADRAADHHQLGRHGGAAARSWRPRSTARPTTWWPRPACASGCSSGWRWRRSWPPSCSRGWSRGRSPGRCGR